MAIDTTPVLVLVAASTAPTAIKNVAEFVCDGTADQVEHESAWAAAASTGGVVVSTPGAYSFSATADFPISDKLTWSGPGASIAAANGLNADLVKFTTTGGTGSTRAVIEGIRFDGNATNQTGGHIINATGARYCTFRQCYFYRPHGFAIRLGPAADSSFTHHNEVTDCRFEYNTTHTSGDGGGVLCEDSDENMIHHNIFEGMGRSGASKPTAIHDLGGLQSIDHNQVVTGGYGVWLERAHSVVDHNVFDGAGSYSSTAQVRMNGNKNIVDHNRFYNIGFNRSANSADGIYCDNTQDNRITGNQFRVISAGSARSGINLDFSPVNNLIDGNVFTTFDTPAFATAPITGGLANNIIRHNYGFKTESKGTATVASGTTSIAVTHGLAVTPTAGDIKISPTNDPTTTVDWWFDTLTSTQFTIRTSANPGVSGYSFAWQVQVL